MRQWIGRHSKSTLHLAVTYLAIIICVSLVYSLVMYQVTARELVLQLKEPNGNQRTLVGVAPDVSKLDLPSSGVIKKGASGKRSLRQNLIILNSAVLILGAPFCFLLARRTLRPIEEVMDAQARFSSDAAHELRTPITALRAKNEVALRNPKLTLDQAKLTMQSSIDQAIRLEKLSDALLQLSAAGSTLAPTSVIHLEDVANEAMNIQAHAAQDKHIAISDEVSNILVHAHRQDVVQIISILLDNAIKYSSPQSTIVITSQAEPKWGTLNVVDTGQGIRASDVPRIFDRFYRADHARTASGTPSYGLGLSIAQKLATQNNGTLRVQSKLGQGSTFSLRLPRAQTSPQA